MIYWETTAFIDSSINNKILSISVAKELFSPEKMCTAVRLIEEDCEWIDPYWKTWCFFHPGKWAVVLPLEDMKDFFRANTILHNRQYVLPFNLHKELHIIQGYIKNKACLKSWTLLSPGNEFVSGEIVTAFKKSYRHKVSQDWIWEYIPEYKKIKIDDYLIQICNEDHPWRFMRENQTKVKEAQR